MKHIKKFLLWSLLLFPLLVVGTVLLSSCGDADWPGGDTTYVITGDCNFAETGCTTDDSDNDNDGTDVDIGGDVDVDITDDNSNNS